MVHGVAAYAVGFPGGMHEGAYIFTAPVHAIQSVVGSDPDIPFPILCNIIDGTVTQSVSHVKDGERVPIVPVQSVPGAYPDESPGILHNTLHRIL